LFNDILRIVLFNLYFLKYEKYQQAPIFMTKIKLNKMNRDIRYP